MDELEKYILNLMFLYEQLDEYDEYRDSLNILLEDSYELKEEFFRVIGICNKEEYTIKDLPDAIKKIDIAYKETKRKNDNINMQLSSI